MALMPEDLENKRFTPVRFSEGYDMDEVDNYLDLEVLPRLQELIDENARLTKELEEAHNRVAELESSAQDGSAASAAAPAEPAEDATSETAAVSESTAAPEAATAETGATEADTAALADAQSTQDAAAAVAETPDQSAAGIIALANRLHDEHVRNGEAERDRLISEANDEHQRIVGEAEEKSRTTLDDLETKKADLEKKIEKLRTFERDYRNRLRNYLENQLSELETSETQDKHANFGL
ncbi:DivIVA domain-containing protein [Brachybacterium halotolerans subsp. kimchii]|uniref:DivIVA domain-containing protein n=1 Tax=Brachybacterium halotolerans TaxID=2795215 RepID=UPI001E3F8403|nr:DivIVA domain-containing protein [Brachybacterium halotolerans]UEJ83646.1 DivIVA domain-containing protein [Brachybacterium halotolerans subsp. kimchii]